MEEQNPNNAAVPADDNRLLKFDFPKSPDRIIKAIGIGGGGGNAVNYMYQKGIRDITFAVCNTDRAALLDSPVPVHVLLGEGLGAGNDPAVGRQKATENTDLIRSMLNDGTKMVFITAGMGGGTGTGASPVIARVAREMGILTVAIVTIPFLWEGNKKIDQALDGIENLSKEVDALMVISNERLRTVYPDKTVLSAFAKADDTLTVAAQSIVELINKTGNINVDFRDVNTVLRGGGVAIISTGYGEGEHRVTKAIEDAINSPLLNDNDIYNSQKILINLYTSDNPDHTLTMDEMTEVSNFMARFNKEYECKPGLTVDSSLGPKVKITILASGFHLADETFKDEDKLLSQRTTEEQMHRESRRSKYYPATRRSVRKKPYHRCFRFDSDASLDDDNLIEQVVSTPVYKRTGSMLKALNEEKTLLTPKAPAPVKPTPAAQHEDAISFLPFDQP